MTPAERSPAPVIHYDVSNKPPVPQRPYTNPNLLSPDAIHSQFPPRIPPPPPEPEHFSQEDRDIVEGDTLSLGRSSRSRRRRRRDAGRSGTRRGKGVWKKLLWVKQRDCEDNISHTISLISVLNVIQIRTITRIRLHSSLTSSATLVFDPTTSGPWSRIPLSSCSMCHRSSSSSARSTAFTRSECRPLLSSVGALHSPSWDG